jgi:hypothetical protein
MTVGMIVMKEIVHGHVQRQSSCVMMAAASVKPGYVMETMIVVIMKMNNHLFVQNHLLQRNHAHQMNLPVQLDHASISNISAMGMMIVEITLMKVLQSVEQNLHANRMNSNVMGLIVVFHHLMFVMVLMIVGMETMA